MPSIVLRLSPEYHSAIKQLAKRERRSIAAQLMLFVDRGMRDVNALPTDTKPVSKAPAKADDDDLDLSTFD